MKKLISVLFSAALITTAFAKTGGEEMGFAGVPPLENIHNLATHFVECQNQFLPVSPPSDEVYLHSNTPVLPVKWRGFPRKFKKGMIAEMDSNGFPCYRVGIYEDAKTRETVFLNGMGVEVHRLSPAEGYNPYAFQMGKLGIATLAELEPHYDWIFDPAKIAAEYILLPNRFYGDYQLVKEEERQLEALSMAATSRLMAEPEKMMAFRSAPDPLLPRNLLRRRKC